MKSKYLYFALTLLFLAVTAHFLSIEPTPSHTILAIINLCLTVGFAILFSNKSNIKN